MASFATSFRWKEEYKFSASSARAIHGCSLWISCWLHWGCHTWKGRSAYWPPSLSQPVSPNLSPSSSSSCDPLLNFLSTGCEITSKDSVSLFFLLRLNSLSITSLWFISIDLFPTESNTEPIYDTIQGVKALLTWQNPSFTFLTFIVSPIFIPNFYFQYLFCSFLRGCFCVAIWIDHRSSPSFCRCTYMPCMSAGCFLSYFSSSSLDCSSIISFTSE